MQSMLGRPAVLSISLLLVFTVTICNPGTTDAHILRMSDGETIPLSELVRDLQEVRVIFFGESHDNPGHHRAQLQLIHVLSLAGVDVAIGLEMFRAESQPALDKWVAGGLSLDEFLKVYHDNWSYWREYQEIYFYARDKGIPMIGLNVSRELISQVARNGFGSLSGKQLEKLPVARCMVDPVYMDFIRRALGGHRGTGNNFTNFCEAQLLWDKVMAKNLADYLTSNPGKVVVVLAGSGHSWKYGIPAQLNEIKDIPYRVLLPEFPGRWEADSVSFKDTDYLLLGVEQAPLH